MGYISQALTFFTKTPTYCILFVTARCNARCAMCFNWDSIQKWQSKKELSLEEIEKISQNLGTLERLTLSGGEPLMRDDLEQIIKTFYLQNNLQTVAIPTNGFYVGRVVGLIRSLINDCPGLHIKVCLSVDDLEDKHDEIRAVPGLFKKVLECYDQLDQLNQGSFNKYFEIQLNCTVSRYNYSSIPKMYKYFLKRCPRAFFNTTLARGELPTVSSRFNSKLNTPEKDKTNSLNWEEYKDLTKKREAYISKHPQRNFKFSYVINAIRMGCDEVILRHLRGLNRSTTCLAGKRLLIINEEGDTFPCETLWQEKSFGNLRDFGHDFKKIMLTNQYRSILKSIFEKKCSCTFENAIMSSYAYAPSFWPNIIVKTLRIIRYSSLKSLGKNSKSE